MQARPHPAAPPLAALAMAGGACLFAVMAIDVAAQGQWTSDLRFAQWLQAQASPALTAVMLLASRLHGTLPILLYALLAITALAWQRQRYWVAVWVLTVPFGLLLNALLKLAFHRVRPELHERLAELPTSFSFPSGHAAGAVLFYGAALALFYERVRDWRWRGAATLAALVLIALVCISRVYLGVHYLSDVLAAVVEAIAWLAFSLMAAARWRAAARPVPDPAQIP